MDILINPSMILKNLKNILKTKINLKKKKLHELMFGFFRHFEGEKTPK
jgi:hypothetical protein